MILEKLPMPPTSNHRLMPAHGRLIKSPEIRAYDQKVELWGLRNRHKLLDYEKHIGAWLKEGFLLEIELDFCFPKEKLVTKQNDPKRLDVDSRIKSSLDSISKLLRIDDKWFIKMTAKKIILQSSDAHVIAKLNPIRWSKVEPILARKDGPLL